MTNSLTSTPTDNAVTRSRTVGRVGQLLPLGLVALLSTALGVASTLPGLIQGALAVSMAILLGVACIRAPGPALLALVAWLTVLATIRRLLDASGFGATTSPLLLVSPVAVAVLVIVAARKGAFRTRTSLANGVLVLTGLVVLSAVNPLQGGITVGVAGLLFVLVPMLWFWLGRALVDDELLGRLLRMISILAVPAAIYGLIQVYRGFPWWDAYWIENKGYVALRVGDALRQFASFASTSEYVGYLAVGVLVWTLQARRAGRLLPTAGILAVLCWALALASARAILVALPVALGLVFAAKRGFGLGRSALFGLGGLVVLAAVVSTFDSGKVGNARTSALLARQVEGLSDPFNSDVSTLPVHVEAFVGGLSLALRNPVGQGVGSVTIAAERFGGEAVNTETDPSNVAVALGIPGLLVYSFVVIAGFRLAFRTARTRRDMVSLAALGILVVTSFQWLNGGTYSVAPLPWLVLGWLDRQSRAVPALPVPAP